jgi:plastocyanin
MGAVLATGACGGSSSSGGTGGSGGKSTTTTTGTGGSTGTGTNIVDTCNEATAMDATSMNAVTINFGGSAGLAYSPKCVKVKAGTMVTFSGSFTTHPLAGGNSPPTVDATSPIHETKTGMSAAFTMSSPGAYGFFCEVHFGSGMQGAIFVQ